MKYQNLYTERKDKKMGNRVSIRQTESRYAGQDNYFKSVMIFDDYGEGSVLFEDLGLDSNGDFIICADELLTILLKKGKDGELNSDFIDILDSICDDQKGVEIDGMWYNWDEIEDNFHNYY